ncbi:hypothetical protein G6F52_014027 [Rhizopus delemar]|nr:hypothetical protein G6F52_014027 [Rhizopus delemar]
MVRHQPAAVPAHRRDPRWRGTSAACGPGAAPRHRGGAAASRAARRAPRPARALHRPAPLRCRAGCAPGSTGWRAAWRRWTPDRRSGRRCPGAERFPPNRTARPPVRPRPARPATA